MSEPIYDPRQYPDDLPDDDKEIDPALLEQDEDMTDTLNEDLTDRWERIEETEDVGSEQSEDTREQLEDLDQET